MKHLEYNLQCQCFNWFRLQYKHKMFVHVPNERKNKMEAVRLKRAGVLAGIPDIFIPEPNDSYDGLFVELKVKPNKPNDTQLLVIDNLRERGYAAYVCYSFEEFVRICENYFN